MEWIEYIPSVVFGGPIMLIGLWLIGIGIFTDIKKECYYNYGGCGSKGDSDKLATSFVGAFVFLAGVILSYMFVIKIRGG